MTEAANYTEFQIKAQFAKALIMPGGMGETFKVLAQYKGVDDKAREKLKKLIPNKYDLGLPNDKDQALINW